MIRSVGFGVILQIIDERDDKLLLLFVEGCQAAEGQKSFGARILLNVKEFGWSQHEVIADVKEDGHGGHHTSVLDPIDVGRGETEETPFSMRSLVRRSANSLLVIGGSSIG